MARYDKTADSVLGFAALSSIRLWIRFVHMTFAACRIGVFKYEGYT